MPLNSPPAAPERLVVATANAGKLREFRELLAGLPLEMVSLASIGLSSPEETGMSFRENALLKARHAQSQTQSAVLADDSGLEVDALGGAPGIRSARYAGIGADDFANNAKLIAALHGVRLRAKRVRYAAEMFATLHDAKAAKRFIERLSDLQERLGVLNDGAVASHLLLELGGPGGRHAYAAGAIAGYMAARAGRIRPRIVKAFQRFRRQHAYWA